MRSIARFRAVVTSHARGLAGGPSRGQRFAAIANASWAASSARSKSPRKPISAATTRPHSSRKMRSSSPLGHRAHLDCAAHAGRRHARGELDRGVEVVGLVEEVAAERLLDGDERAVGRQRLAVPYAHRRRHLGRLHPDARRDSGGLVDRLVGRVNLLLLVLGQAPPGLLVVRRRGLSLVNQQQVLHRASSFAWSVMSRSRRTANRREDTRLIRGRAVHRSRMTSVTRRRWGRGSL